MLVVYVDDMKMAGPENEMDAAWKALGKHINLEVPKGDTEDKITFLGCESARSESTIRGHNVCGIKYDISGQLRKALAKYEAGVQRCTGLPVEYRSNVKTPFLQEETKHSVHRAPAEKGDFIECPCCLHTIPVADVPAITHKAGEPRKITEIWKDKNFTIW